MKQILFALALSVSLLGLTACNKPNPVQVSIATPVVSNPVVSQPAPATNQTQPKAPEVPKVVTPVGVKVHVVKKNTTSHRNQQERAAYRVAMINKLVYLGFERLYAVIGAPSSQEIANIDKNKVGFVTRLIQYGVVTMDDVEEFAGKV